MEASASIRATKEKVLSVIEVCVGWFVVDLFFCFFFDLALFSVIWKWLFGKNEDFFHVVGKKCGG